MRGRISFEAGGRKRELAFTTSAMMAYEERFDESFLGLVDKLSGDQIANLRVTFLSDLFGIALRACDPEISDDDLRSVLDDLPAKEIITLIGQAVSAAFPEDETPGGNGGNGRKARKPK